MKKIAVILVSLWILVAPFYAQTQGYYPGPGPLPVGSVGSNGLKRDGTNALSTTLGNIGTNANSFIMAPAVCDGITDDTAAINNALSTALSNNIRTVYLPARNCYSATGITYSGVNLSSFNGGFLSDGTNFLGSKITCAATVANCVILSGNSNLRPNGLYNVSVAFNGASPAAGNAVEVFGGHNVVLSGVCAENATNGFYVEGGLGSSNSDGVSLFGDKLCTGAISNADIVFNTWPEAHISNSRFGSGSGIDVSHTAYIEVTGGISTSPAAGPNTLTFVNDQFNTGSTVSYFMEFVNFGASVGAVDAREWKVIGSHIEGVQTGVFFSDSTVTALAKLTMIGDDCNCSSAPFWDLNAATEPEDNTIIGGQYYVTTFSLAPTNGISNLSVHGAVISTSSSSTINNNNVSGSNASITGNTFGSNLTISGSSWGDLKAIGNSYMSGSQTVSASRSSSGHIITDESLTVDENTTTSQPQLLVGEFAPLFGASAFEINTSFNGTQHHVLYNSSSGVGAITSFDLGNNTSSGEVSFNLNGGANTSGNGTNSFTINATGGMWLNGNGNKSLSIGTSGAATLYNQPTTGTIAYAVCAAANANGTTGGAVILDTSGTVCGLSSEQFKHDIKKWRPAGHFKNACAEQEMLRPIEYEYDLKIRPDPGKHAGLGAWATAYVDERLIARDKKGWPRGIRWDAVETLTLACQQEMVARLAAIGSP